MNKILVIIFGFLSILFVYWFFLGKKKKATIVSGSVDIIVEGGYSPETIEIKKGKPVTLNFTRKDPNNCLEEVILGDFKVRKQLPLNEKVSVEIIPQKEGEFTYSCGMGMYHGKIIVK